MISNLIMLFKSFLQIGLFSIGGGYATIPLIQQQVVESHQWLNMSEFTNIITISQMTPGPLAINTSTFVGLRIAGVPGAIVATLGCVLSGIIISFLFYKLFSKYKDSYITKNGLKGLQACSIGLISSSSATLMIAAFYNIETLAINILAIIVFIVSLFVLRRYKINPILIIIITGFIGIIVY